MNLTQLKSELLSSVPEELYKIEPGQIVILTPQEGLTEQTAYNLSNLFHTFSHFGFGEQIKLQVLPTDKPELLGAVVGRKENETSSPYNIIISDDQSLVGFLAEYFSLDFDEFASRAKLPMRRMGNKPNQRPIIIPINPDDYPIKEGHKEQAQYNCPYMNGGGGFDGVQALVAESNRPTISTMQNKIADLLSRCEQYGYDIDVVGLKSTARESMRMAKDFKLKLDFQYKKQRTGYVPSDVLGVCDIYIVGDGNEHKVNLRPAEKALYLTTILQEGFYLADVSFSFLKDMATIFSRIPEHQEREQGIKTQEQSTSGIGVMKKRIRDAITAAIGFGPAVDEFAIEGYRGEEVSIRKATDKHREQIKKYFGL